MQYSTTEDTSSSLEDKLGFIMMECGFEGVSFKVSYFIFMFSGTEVFGLYTASVYYG